MASDLILNAEMSVLKDWISAYKLDWIKPAF